MAETKSTKSVPFQKRPFAAILVALIFIQTVPGICWTSFFVHFFWQKLSEVCSFESTNHGGSTLRIFLYFSLLFIEKRHDRFWPFKKLFQVLVECCLILWPSLPLLLIPAPWARRIFLRLAGFGQAAWLGLAVTCLRFVSKSKIYIHCKGMTLQEMQQMSGDLLMISTFNRQNGLLES